MIGLDALTPAPRLCHDGAPGSFNLDPGIYNLEDCYWQPEPCAVILDTA